MSFTSRILLAGALGGVALATALSVLPYPRFTVAIAAGALGVLALHDRLQTDAPLLRNYPVLGRLHGLLEVAWRLLGLRQAQAPYSPAQVELVRTRAQGGVALSAFGVMLEPAGPSILHAVQPSAVSEIEDRVLIGGGEHAYSASPLNISALAFGAISERAIEALSRGARAGGFYYNTGEAGLPDSFLRGGGDLVWQLGTGYFGCRNRDGSFDEAAYRERAALPSVKMIEIKLSQGSKPARGGLLPGSKVSRRVAEVCQIPQGQDSVLPATHRLFSTPLQLLDTVARLRDGAGGKPVGVKLCVGQSADLFAIVKAMLSSGITPDFLSIDGAEGGTGAAPVELQSSVGLPLGLALPLVRDALLGVGLRERVRVIASGKILTASDMVAAIARGADLCAAARPFLLALGCIQALTCASNNCPVGLTTQRAYLEHGLVPQAQARKVTHFHEQTLAAFRELVAATGRRSAAEIEPSMIVPAAPAPAVAAGQLAAGDVPAVYATSWERASAERFGH